MPTKRFTGPPARSVAFVTVKLGTEVELFTAHIGNELLVGTAVPKESFLFRVHPSAGEPYDRMIVVTELDEGRTLHLCGWIGKPLTPAQWRAAKEQFFPKAEWVEFERRRDDGTFKNQRLPFAAISLDAPHRPCHS